MSDSTSLESLFHLVHALKRQLHNQIEQLDLGITPMHVRVIKIINKKSPCTALDITRYLERDKAQVTRLINSLIEKELVIKEANPNDKRSQYLRITANGLEVVSKIAHIDANTMSTMTKDLTTEEIAEFQRISKHMATKLRT